MNRCVRVVIFHEIVDRMCSEPEIVKRDVQRLVLVRESLLDMLQQHRSLAGAFRTLYRYEVVSPVYAVVKIAFESGRNAVEPPFVDSEYFVKSFHCLLFICLRVQIYKKMFANTKFRLILVFANIFWGQISVSINTKTRPWGKRV